MYTSVYRGSTAVWPAASATTQCKAVLEQMGRLPRGRGGGGENVTRKEKGKKEDRERRHRRREKNKQEREKERERHTGGKKEGTVEKQTAQRC